MKVLYPSASDVVHILLATRAISGAVSSLETTHRGTTEGEGRLLQAISFWQLVAKITSVIRFFSSSQFPHLKIVFSCSRWIHF